MYSVSNEKVAEITIRSFTLLGLSLDTYVALANFQLTPSSFDRTNEKLLLCLLHFLLEKLDTSFAMSVTSCWPFYETREKNEFKRIVTQCIGKVNSSNPTLSNADFRTSLLSVAKGPAVWMLLRRLCDILIEQSIKSLILTNQNDATVAMTLRQSAGLWETLASTDVIELTTAVRHEYDCLVREGDVCTARQKEQILFSSELDERLKIATKNIETAKLKIAKVSKSEKVNYLTENAQIERSELIFQIKEMYAALNQLSSSNAFTDCDKIIEFYSDIPKKIEKSFSIPMEIKLENDEKNKLNNELNNENNANNENIDLNISIENRNINENNVEIRRTNHSTVWQLETSTLIPLCDFLESYSLSKKTRIKEEINQGKLCH